MPAYLMLYSALFVAVCLYNACLLYFLFSLDFCIFIIYAMLFCNVQCFHALSMGY